MLLELRIKNFLLIEEAQLSLDKGLIVFTGETGAGKSLLIKAIKLLLGEKGGSQYIKLNTDKAEIEGLFYISEDLVQKLANMGYDVEEEIHIKRIITPVKQRAFLNGSLITLSELSEIAKGLVSITSQHEHYTFLDKENQLRLLDDFLNLTNKVLQYQEKFREYQSLKRKVKELSEHIKEVALKKDYLQFQISEIEDLSPDPEEEENLILTRQRLKHLSQIKELLFGLKASLEPIYGNLNQALNYLQKLKPFEPRLSEKETTFQNFYYELRELERDILSMENTLPEDDRELNQIEARLAKYEKLKKKYQKNTQELLLFKEALKKELTLMETGEEELEKLLSQCARLEKEVLDLSRELSEIRKKEKGRLETILLKELQNLGMEKASFEINLKPKNFEPTLLTPYGIDEIEYLFSPNPGLPLRPIEKVASGGELSRIFLAMRTLVKDKKGIGTLLFDEVDTGIGGHTAIKVGEKLKELSKEIQIICITHLPQIAKFADNHFVVEKILDDKESKTILRKVEREDRLKELARMLGDINNIELAIKFLEGAFS